MQWGYLDSLYMELQDSYMDGYMPMRIPMGYFRESYRGLRRHKQGGLDGVVGEHLMCTEWDQLVLR
eukprot:11795408-Alexandrium_andersonii.AAC.1